MGNCVCKVRRDEDMMAFYDRQNSDDWNVDVADKKHSEEEYKRGAGCLGFSRSTKYEDMEICDDDSSSIEKYYNFYEEEMEDDSEASSTSEDYSDWEIIYSEHTEPSWEEIRDHDTSSLHTLVMDDTPTDPPPSPPPRNRRLKTKVRLSVYERLASQETSNGIGE